MVSLIKKGVAYFSMRQDKTKWHVYASHASFYVIVSAVPMLMLILMLVGKLMPERIEYYLTMVKEHLPPQLSSYIPEEFVSNAMTANIPLVSLTVVLMIWSSSKGVRAISQGLESIYGMAGKRSVLKSYFFALVYTAVFILLILLALGILVFGETIVSFLAGRKDSLNRFLRPVMRIGRIFTFFVFVLFFAAIYKFMAGGKYPFHKHLPGALFAAGGWLVYSAILSLYLRLFSPEKYLLYGSLGALLLLMLWVHSCMTILMLGGELNILLLNRPVLIGRKGET